MDLFSLHPLATIGRLARRFRTARTESRTRHMIEALPRHMRKDIGSPDASLLSRRSDAGSGWSL